MSSHSNYRLLVHETNNRTAEGSDTRCFKFGQGMYSKGYWFKEDPLEYTIPLLVLQITLSFLASRAFYFLLRPLKQPKFVCNVLGGIVLGPSGLGRNAAFIEKLFPSKETLMMNTIATIAALLFVFLTAIKMDIGLMIKTGKKATSIGVACLLFPFSVFTILFVLLHKYLYALPQGPFLFFVSASFSVTCFPVLAYSLDELNLLTSELGQLAMSSAMTNDLVGWCFLALAILVTQKHPSYSLWAILSLAALITFSVYVLRPLIVRIIKKTPVGRPVDQTHVVTILTGSLFMAFISDMIGATSVDGPLILGLIIPDGPPLGDTLVEKTELMISHFLMPIFYLAVGVNTNFSALRDWTSIGLFFLIITVGCLAKLVGVLLASLHFGLSLGHALSLGLIMNIRGVIELITYLHWRAHEFADEEAFTIVVLSVVTVTAIVTPLIEILRRPPTKLGGIQMRWRTIQSTPITGEFRILTCLRNDVSVQTIITILEALNPTEESSLCAYVIHHVNFIGRAVPMLIPQGKKKKTSKLTGSDHIMGAFENYSENSYGRVTIQAFLMMAPYKTMHETICRFAQEKLIPLILLPYHENQEIYGRDATILREFNTNIQAHAPCTVGFLLDRGLPIQMSCTNFTYHVVVLFFGGADDRESLAFGTRMSSHPRVRITLLRFRDKNDDQSDKQLDDALIGEFKQKNTDNACVVYHELIVDDAEKGLMEAVQSLEHAYNLVMVGRRRLSSSKLFNEETVRLVETAKLGIVGERLASATYVGSSVSVLVVQHCGDIHCTTNTN